MDILDNKKLFLEITRMRETVQRAQVLAIRKILRKVNKLQRKKGNETEKIKNAQKAERLINETKEMKKIKADSVTKFALVNSLEGYLEYIKDEETPAHIKGMARIASEKAIISKLNQIQEKYENWNEVQAILQTTKKVKKKLKKKEKVQNEEANNASENDETPNLEFKSSDDESCSEPDEPPVDDFEDDSENDLEESPENDLEENPENDSEENPEESEVSQSESEEIVEKISKPLTKQSKDMKKKVVSGTNKANNQLANSTQKDDHKIGSSIAVVKRLTNLKELETMELSTISTSNATSDNLKKSSFFLSAEGEEVESDVDDDAVSSSEVSEDDVAATPGFNKVYHARGKTQSVSKRQLPKLGALNNRDQPNFKKRNEGSYKKGNQPSRPQPSAFQSKHANKVVSAPVQPEENKKLHPSWEAKKKLRESIQINVKSSNKKIKFD